MATHSDILACEISWTEEPEGYSPMGSLRVGPTSLGPAVMQIFMSHR